jgi:hypothetical protein
MLVAQKKQQENIAEYILYLFQIEDIVRSLNFDIEQIMESVVKPNLPDSAFEGQYQSWYADIIQEMKRSGLEKKRPFRSSDGGNKGASVFAQYLKCNSGRK